jgi:hypothetical protein
MEQLLGEVIPRGVEDIGEAAPMSILAFSPELNLQSRPGAASQLAKGILGLGGKGLIRCPVAAKLRGVDPDQSDPRTAFQDQGIAVDDVGKSPGGDLTGLRRRTGRCPNAKGGPEPTRQQQTRS